jgi:hypothetical protein
MSWEQEPWAEIPLDPERARAIRARAHAVMERGREPWVEAALVLVFSVLAVVWAFASVGPIA